MSKVSIPTTVEAQIRTRARNLPIYKCYVNRDWEKVQLVTIMIIRKHSNGNITMGNFLVDLKLLGVKDCTYRFNESPLLMDEILAGQHGLLKECDYALVHNIIYAGLEFAGDYGFAPHRYFKTAQYILEEDTDDIPMIDVPLGDEGIPVLTVPSGQTGQREIALLNKTAGGDFRVVFLNKNGQPEPVERAYMEIMDEIIEKGINSYNMKYGDTRSAREMQVIIDLLYMNKVFTDEEKEWIDTEFDRIIKDPRLFMESGYPADKYETELAPAVRYFNAGKIAEYSAEIRKVIDRHPDDPVLWNVFLYDLSTDNGLVDEKAVKEAYSRFPGDPAVKAWYAEWLAQEDHADEVFALFGDAPGLDALTTENTSVCPNALVSFCFACAMAWLSKGDILHAEPYYQVIVHMELNQRNGEYIQERMTFLKDEVLKKMPDTEDIDDEA